MTDTSDAHKKLPLKALKQIRALCKGNGVAPDSVQIKEAHGSVINCEAITHLELHPDISETTKKGRQVAGELVDDPAKIKKEIDELVNGAIKNNDIRKHISKLLIDRPDKGFSLHAEYFDVDPLKKDFCFHQPCPRCQGQGQSNCTRCGGKRREVCSQCHGRTMIPCRYCSGDGFVQGQDGARTQCNRCFGQRQVSCPLCQKAGTIPCRQCKGTGISTCSDCGGAAFFTQITRVNVKLKTLFEIDRSSLPDPVVKIIEDNGTKMVEQGHIKIKAEPVKRDDGGLAIQYMATFPYGDLEFSINGKPLKTHLFGYKGKMLRLPNFLDNLIINNFKSLKEAANGVGAVATNIKKASKSRMIAEGLLLSVSMPPKKAMLSLKKKFPMGASNERIKQIIILSNKALKNVTRKTRLGGLGLGILITALVDALYFIGPIRSTIFSGSIGQSTAIMLIDLALIPLGGFVGAYAAKFMAGRPLKKALGALMPEKQRGRFKPKTQNNNWVSYAISGGILFFIIFITKFTNAATPGWFPF